MGRTNIDLDNDLVGTPLTADFFRRFEGIGWDGDLDALRGDSVESFG